jgi:hypothetical protein
MMAMVTTSKTSTTLYLKSTRISTSNCPSMGSGLIIPGYVVLNNSYKLSYLFRCIVYIYVMHDSWHAAEYGELEWFCDSAVKRCGVTKCSHFGMYNLLGTSFDVQQLRLALPKGPSWVWAFSPLHLTKETDPISERSRLPHFLDNLLTDGSEVVSLMHRPPFTPRKIPGTHFC